MGKEKRANDGEVVDDVVVVVVVGCGGGCSGANDCHDGDEDAPSRVRRRAATPEHLRSEKRDERKGVIFPEQSAISKWPPPLIVRPVIRSCDAESGSGRVAKRRSVLRPSVRPSVLGFDLVSRQ